ncbi:MAG: hypothetical protein M1480_17490 [Bacteroidetes bacterium]|nr:hypothetical protein [Bacteroidota bacterium]
METKQATKKKKLQQFSNEELASSQNKKLKEVAKILNDDSLMQRIKSYKETYWDQAWSSVW